MITLKFSSRHYLLNHRYQNNSTATRGHRGRDRLVVGFTTTYAISVYRH